MQYYFYVIFYYCYYFIFIFIEFLVWSIWERRISSHFTKKSDDEPSRVPRHLRKQTVQSLPLYIIVRVRRKEDRELRASVDTCSLGCVRRLAEVVTLTYRITKISSTNTHRMFSYRNWSSHWPLRCFFAKKPDRLGCAGNFVALPGYWWRNWIALNIRFLADSTFWN